MLAVFQHPWLLPFLAAVPVVWLGLWLRERGRTRRAAEAIGPRIGALVPGHRRRGRALRRVLFVIGLGLALVAALGPMIGPPTGTPQWRGVDVVVCLDVSRSMLARDLAPDRLTRAQQDIVRLSGVASGDRLGLVLFAGEARLAVPLTNDLRSFAELAQLAGTTSVRRGGTDLGAAIDTALLALDARLSDHGAIVLVTDGEDRDGKGLAAARRAAEQGVVVHTVGVGTARGAKISVPVDGGEAFLRDRTGAEVVSTLERTSLERIATAAGGQYVQADETPDALSSLHADRILPEARTVQAETGGERGNAYAVFLLIALLLWMLEMSGPVGRRA